MVLLHPRLELVLGSESQQFHDNPTVQWKVHEQAPDHGPDGRAGAPGRHSRCVSRADTDADSHRNRPQQDDGAAEAPDDASKEVKAIYTDYSRDGKIDVCDHARDDLQEALDSIEADFDRDFPDFREALEAGIQRHDDNRCEDDAEATPTATATPDDSTTTDPPRRRRPTTARSRTPTPRPTTAARSRPTTARCRPTTAAHCPRRGRCRRTGAAPAPTAVPTAAPPAAAATPAPSPTPAIVTRSGTDGLLIPGILIGVALLGAAALAFSAIGGAHPAACSTPGARRGSAPAAPGPTSRTG